MSSTGQMLGVVNLDKPVGVTSHDMVGLMRRLTGMRRIGHAGTLDPLASGVLPVLIGAATRFSEELTGGRKRYTAVARFGVRSITDDAEGPLEPSGADLPDAAAIERALAGQRGTFDQRPPTFSARKQGGQTAHRAARRGTPLDLPPRRVTVDRLDLVAFTRGDGWADASLEIECGPGTYIRSIARDLGEALGCGAYLHALRRTAAAGLQVDEGHAPDELEALADAGRLTDAVLPIASLLPFPTLVVDGIAFRHGSPTPLGPAEGDGRRVVVDPAGELLGIGSVTGGMLRPEKVIATVGTLAVAHRSSTRWLTFPGSVRRQSRWASLTACTSATRRSSTPRAGPRASAGSRRRRLSSSRRRSRSSGAGRASGD